ncbi:hypothetical protein F5141DRAFT_1209639 [Pisolithus sp. B1]|nr:hypothetical protein F5141DRAFT_1209639 [Pisolithus sp. B1]
MCKELAAVGVSLSDDEYTSTIICSLPTHYATFIAHLSASAHLLKQTLKPDDVMCYLTQEFDQLNAGKAESSKGDKGVAFTALGSASGNRDQKTKQKKGVCWKCGGKGHRKDQCPSPSQDDKGKSSTSGKDSSKDLKPKDQSKGNSANVAEFKEDGAWVASAVSTDSEAEDLDFFEEAYQDLPDLADGSDPEYWFSEAEEDDALHAESENQSGAHLDTTVAQLSAKSADDPGIAAAISPGPHNPDKVVELYNSGTTHHLSPYQDHFITFCPIPPKGFDTANQQTFSATGVGDMMVEVPNGVDTSQICLMEDAQPFLQMGNA